MNEVTFGGDGEVIDENEPVTGEDTPSPDDDSFNGAEGSDGNVDPDASGESAGENSETVMEEGAAAPDQSELEGENAGSVEIPAEGELVTSVWVTYDEMSLLIQSQTVELSSVMVFCAFLVAGTMAAIKLWGGRW